MDCLLHPFFFLVPFFLCLFEISVMVLWVRSDSTSCMFLRTVVLLISLVCVSNTIVKFVPACTFAVVVLFLFALALDCF